ncbi:hypothetical protein GCM10011325_46390 [Dyadobacter sediminis]|nr:hypothetical protein GCM10011325_46390 [Dyadobacter sediminis]
MQLNPELALIAIPIAMLYTKDLIDSIMSFMSRLGHGRNLASGDSFTMMLLSLAAYILRDI